MEEQNRKYAQGNAEEAAVEQNNFPTANIVVAGITGTGKSTLLNAVFGKDFAKTGKGRPITAQIDEYESEDIPIHIWDTVGLELDSAKTKASIDAIRTTIASKVDAKDQFDHIHAIWYCINAGSNRYQGEELEFIKSLHSIGVPFIIVMTQCIGAEEEIAQFENTIREINNSMGMNDIEIVKVCAKEFKLFGGYTVPAFGLKELVETTTNSMPDFIKGGFVAAQNVSKVQKREYCGEIIVKYVDAAIGGFWDKVPIVNIFTTDNKIHKMFSEIGKLYNSIIPENRIQEVIDHMGSMDIEHTFLGLVLPVSRKFDQRIDNLFDKKEREGFVVPVEKLGRSERVARMLVRYGYLFLEAVEELWEQRNESMLENIDTRIQLLKGKLDDKFNKKAR